MKYKNSFLLAGIVLILITTPAIYVYSNSVVYDDNPNWSMKVFINGENTSNDSIELETLVALNGVYTVGATVEDARVCFLDEQNETMEVVPVGRISDENPRTNVSVTLPHRPAVIAIGYGKIETDANYSVWGLRVGENTLETFVQGRSYC